jgi:hypothetical protein
MLPSLGAVKEGTLSLPAKIRHNIMLLDPRVIVGRMTRLTSNDVNFFCGFEAHLWSRYERSHELRR